MEKLWIPLLISEKSMEEASRVIISSLSLKDMFKYQTIACVVKIFYFFFDVKQDDRNWLLKMEQVRPFIRILFS